MTIFTVVFEQNELYTKTFSYQNGIMHQYLPVLKNTTWQIDENMYNRDDNGYIDGFYTDTFVFPRTDTYAQLCAGCLNFVNTLTIKREIFTRRNDIANRLIYGYFHGYDPIDETLPKHGNKKTKIHYFVYCDNCYVDNHDLYDFMFSDEKDKKHENDEKDEEHEKHNTLKNTLITKIYGSSFVVLECIRDDRTNKKTKQELVQNKRVKIYDNEYVDFCIV